MPDPKNLQAHLAQVTERYQLKLGDYAESLTDLWQQTNSGNSNPDILSQIRFQLHKLRGPAKTLGFEKVGELAEICETKISDLESQGMSAASQLIHLPAMEELLALLFEVSTHTGGQDD